jgi:hypothetical protein
LSASFTMADAGGRVFWVSAGAVVDALVDGAELALLLALSLDLLQPVMDTRASTAAKAPTIKVRKQGGCMLSIVFRSGVR